jgi:hypothetical protein
MTLLVEMSSGNSCSITYATRASIRSFPGNITTIFLFSHTFIKLDFPFSRICVDRTTAMFYIRKYNLNILAHMYE